jgi:hypothetical protein
MGHKEIMTASFIPLVKTTLYSLEQHCDATHRRQNLNAFPCPVLLQYHPSYSKKMFVNAVAASESC